MKEIEARDDDINGDESIYETVSDEEHKMSTCVAYGTHK